VDAQLRKKNALEEKRMLAGENNGVWRLCGRRGRRTRLCEAAWENTREKREGPYAHLGQDSSVGGAGNLILY